MTFEVLANNKGIREVDTNDHLMKTVNLTMGRSTILSFGDKPIKVVTGNSNYFNIEYIGNDLTIQPLAAVETNLFVYTESKAKYGFHLRVGPVANYDDMVYVKWKNQSEMERYKTTSTSEKPQIKMKTMLLRSSYLELEIKSFLRLKGSRTYIVDFDVKNKGSLKTSINEVKVFASRNSERLKGQRLFFDSKELDIHEVCRGRLFISIPEDKDFAIYLDFHKKLQKIIVSKVYL
jgi:hypothetical protein